ncbi:caspase family protein [Sinorhizobium sp. BG8]|uniref:caspase family protein n=1 Tax=Sinorhizobium sp. BG8 TaxID=2613773 RepID=UPI00193D13DF|nr:caspase family protein [Sinorhizobium sp. BG8]
MAIMAVVLAVAIFGGPRSAAAEDRALLIGIGTYINLPEKMTLHGPQNDVAAVKTLLTSKLGYADGSIRVLLDQAATRAAIVSSIEDWLVAGTKPGDRAYLYFSGYGLQVADADGDEEDGLDEALAPYDIQVGDTDWGNAISDDEIDTALAQLKDRAVSLVIDACHSGTIARSVSGEMGEAIEGARFLPRLHPKPVEAVKTRGLRIDLAVVGEAKENKQGGLEAWSAASSYQIAWEDDRQPANERHGVFTEAYVAGHELADGNGNGTISLSELFEFVKAQSQAYCAAKEGCHALDPQLDVADLTLGASVITQASATAGQNGSTYVSKENTQAVGLLGKPSTGHGAQSSIEALEDILGREDTGDVHLSLDPGVQLKQGTSSRSLWRAITAVTSSSTTSTRAERQRRSFPTKRRGRLHPWPPGCR